MNAYLELEKTAQDLLFRDARTAGTFTGEPVTDEQVRALWDLVRWAPTAFNEQPMRVVLVRSAEARERLIPHLWEANQAKTRRAPLTAILAADLEFHHHLPRLFPVLPTLKDELFADAGVREESARTSATLQAAYFILGVRALGLAAGPMTGFDAASVDREFFPDGRRRALLIVNIGKPDPDVLRPRLPRLEYDQVFTSL